MLVNNISYLNSRLASPFLVYRKGRIDHAMRLISQDWHNKVVTQLFNSSKGDLILNNLGHLCQRSIWGSNGPSSWVEMPWNEHRPGTALARISESGWTLTASGADYILENCCIGTTQDRNKLETIAKGKNEQNVT